MKEHEKQAIEGMTEVIEHLERLTRDVVGARPSPKMYAQELYNAGYRMHSVGEWKTDDCSKYLVRYRCSNCDCIEDVKKNFCPNCGARMKGGPK